MAENLHIGGLLFEGIDQCDFTAPFEVLSRLPYATFHVIAKETQPVRDARGLLLTPEVRMAEAPRLDVLLVPGGAGVNPLMEDHATLAFIRERARECHYVISVCTGALLLGAAGLLQGRRATTHWASHDLLAAFGAVPQHARVVVDGNIITCAGVTAGIDGALRLTALLRGEEEARRIQLYLEYAPEPPFGSGAPSAASKETIAAVQERMRPVLGERTKIVGRITNRH